MFQFYGENESNRNFQFYGDNIKKIIENKILLFSTDCDRIPSRKVPTTGW